MDKKIKILIVEDDESIRDILHAFIHQNGYLVVSASDGMEGYDLFVRENPQLVVLDIMMPRMNGYDLLTKIRRLSDTPVILLTALGKEQEQARGFDLQADDYIVKPFSYTILIKRIEAVLRRNKRHDLPDDIIRHGEVELRKKSCEIRFRDNLIDFTPKEYELIKLMLENQDHVFTRNHLLDVLWGEEYYGNEKIIDNHIKNIRKKLDCELIQTVWGMGYKISSENKK
ncbi:response regulator transcription factor [Blautia schinkii]|nr:response regulator transcription factor [Blautia schinkii]